MSTVILVVAAVAGASGCGNREARQRESAGPADAASESASAKAREERDAAREAERLAALWSYYDAPEGKRRQVSAAIYSTNEVDLDGSLPRPVRLVFRDHPAWGRSSYLVIPVGDFNCRPGCKVTVTADGGAPKTLAGRRPPTDEAIAMFINDWKALWRTTANAATLDVEFPIAAGGTRKVRFDVAGLDESKMPGW